LGVQTIKKEEMKITQSNKNISPFGGFNFCYDLFQRTGIPELIDEHLGKRVSSFGFNYSDIFTNHMAIFMHGGDCTEDVNDHFRETLKQVKGLSVCSADTILRGIKELATKTIQHYSDSGVSHESNINRRLNKLLVKSLIKVGQLDKTSEYTLDYDNQVIATEKYDAKKTYKKCDGYQSGIATIGKHIVYIEGRNGNSPAKYKQNETLRRTFSLLESDNIKVKRFRADSASYQKEIIELCTQKTMRFYIRATRCASMEQQIGKIEDHEWKKERLGCQQMEIAQIEYTPFGGKVSYRLVVSRIERQDKQRDAFSGQAYIYRAIITNDNEMNNKELTAFYNQRGNSERTFDAMNNDFGWSKLPCSFLNENTSFMIMTALYSNFYAYMIAQFSEKISWLESNFRMKKFVFRFVTVSANWIKTGRKYVLKLYTKKDYSPLMV
jgi:hypothetical protein